MVPEDTYHTIEVSARGIYKEKGSRFISLAFPVKTEPEIKEILNSLRKEFYDARHHCYAYSLGFDRSVYRFNDDGEPSGTGGRPIYGQILSRDLTQILIVVVRYFGGVKLGVPGLINAYRQATKDVLDNAKIIERTMMELYDIRFEYTLMNKVMKILKEENASIQHQEFENSCLLKFAIRKSSGKIISNRLLKLLNVSVNLLDEF